MRAMRRYRATVVLAGVLLRSTAGAAIHTTGGVIPDQDMTIAFADPSSWRCTSHDGCVECRNVARAAASVRLRGGPLPNDVDVPPGAALHICPP